MSENKKHVPPRAPSRLEQEIAGAYYDDEITFEQLQLLVGKEKAVNFQVLKQQLDDDLTEKLAEL